MTRRTPGGVYLANKNDRKRLRKGKQDGKYWYPYSKDQRSPNQAPGDAGGDDPRDTFFSLSPGAVNAITKPGPGGCGNIATTQIKHVQDLVSKHIAQVILGNTFITVGPGGVSGVGGIIGGNGGSGGSGTTAMPPPQPADPFQNPDLHREMQVGEIIGYRCWRLERDILRSVYMSDFWYPDEVMVGRTVTDWGDSGVHAWMEPNSTRFLEYIRGYVHHSFHNGYASIVTGSVYLWGDVVEHTYGYRAEFAKVRSIDWVYPAQADMGHELEILDDLRRVYGVNTVVPYAK